MSLSRILVLVVVVSYTLLTACSSGGGDGGGGGGTTTNNTTTTTTTPGLPLQIDVQQGDYWEFYWFNQTTTFAQSSGSSTSIDYGIFKVTLGAPVTIDGVTAYPVTVTGDAGNYDPRWTHVALGSDGSLLGSTNGLDLETIYDAATAEWNGGGFFHDFSNNAVAASNGTLSGEYNSASGVRVGYGSSDGGCETILGTTICSDTSTTFSFYEYYKSGIGPIGFRQDTYYSSSGGGFFTSHTIRNTVELIETSETATDMTAFKRPDWEEMAPMSTARRYPKAAVLNGEIWVMGGSNGTAQYNSVEIYTPTTNSWRSGPSMPTFGSAEAHTINGKIYIQSYSNSDAFHIYDPNVGSWTTVTSSTSTEYLGDSDSYVDTTFGFGDVILGIDGSTCLSASAKLVGYSISSNVSLVGSSLSIYELLRPSVSIVGDTLYAIGGFGGFSSSSRGGQDWVITYDIINDTWDTSGAADMPTGRDSLQTVVRNGKILALGGNAVSCNSGCPSPTCNFGITYRKVEEYDPVSNTWTELSSMLNPRQDFAAVELSGDVYVIGGNSGQGTLDSMERYRPQ